MERSLTLRDPSLGGFRRLSYLTIMSHLILNLDLAHLCLWSRWSNISLSDNSWYLGENLLGQVFQLAKVSLLVKVRTSTSSTGSSGRWAARGKGTHWGVKYLVSSFLCSGAQPLTKCSSIKVRNIWGVDKTFQFVSLDMFEIAQKFFKLELTLCRCRPQLKPGAETRD